VKGCDDCESSYDSTNNTSAMVAGTEIALGRCLRSAIEAP
jgi:hypothetical protein